MTAWLVLLGILLLASAVAAHPGRLDARGCHWVHRDWTAQDGAVVKAGSYHCHRPLGQFRLNDPWQRLAEPEAPPHDRRTPSRPEEPDR